METTVVYVVTSAGNVMGVYADPEDAYDFQMTKVAKGRLSQLSKFAVTPSSFKSNSKSK